jgi:hypothetical protein
MKGCLFKFNLFYYRTIEIWTVNKLCRRDTILRDFFTVVFSRRRQRNQFNFYHRFIIIYSKEKNVLGDTKQHFL